MALLDQVHEQEGQVVEDVDAGEIIVELDAVEQDRAVAEEHDVGEVEVAVTVADAAFGAAAVEERPVAGQDGPGQGIELADGVGGEDAGDGGVEVGAVAEGDLAHGGVAALAGAGWGRSVGGGDGLGQAVDQGVGQAGRRGDAVEFRLGREAAHFQQPFDRWAACRPGRGRRGRR